MAEQFCHRVRAGAAHVGAEVVKTIGDAVLIHDRRADRAIELGMEILEEEEGLEDSPEVRIGTCIPPLGMLGCAATLEIERKVQSMSQMTQRNTEELKVAEMTCGSCVVHVGEALEGVDGVSSADVDLESGTARVHGERLDRDALVAAIRAEGYDVAIPEE